MPSFSESFFSTFPWDVPSLHRPFLRGAVRKSRAEVEVVASPVELGLLPVMNPGLGCGSRLCPPSWKVICWWVSVTIVVLRYWMVSPVNNFVIPLNDLVNQFLHYSWNSSWNYRILRSCAVYDRGIVQWLAQWLTIEGSWVQNCISFSHYY